MFWKFCVILFFFFRLISCDEDATETNAVEEPKFSQEVDCSRAGGICLLRESCPPEKISETGTCPDQGDSGAVCCHSVSITETRCQHLGGTCRASCPETITLGQANDCPVEEKCCALVN